MPIFKDISLSPAKVLKWILLGLVGLVVVIIAVSLISVALRSAFYATSSVSNLAYEEEYYGYGDGFDAQKAKVARGGFVSSDSAVAPYPISPPIIPGVSTGVDAEGFEVTDYHVSYQTGKLEETCASIESLKPRADVIFEHAHQGDNNCSYSFKVSNESADEIVTILQGLHPKTFNENTSTIKPVIENISNQQDILRQKLSSLEAALTEAQVAYDEVKELAAQAEDIETLAQVINNKVSLIERLSQQRISINQQIAHLQRTELEQRDRLQFTFFSVSVQEWLIIDGTRIKESWQREFRSLIQEFNDTLQGLTVKLAQFILQVALVLIYFALGALLLLLVAKYGWRAGRRIWKS